MNYKLYFQILLYIIAAFIIALIGFFIGKKDKEKGTVFDSIIDVFKFIVNTERLSLPGKVNFGGGILIIILTIITSIPNYFTFIYNLIFKDQIIKISESNINLIYMVGCSLSVSLIESLIRYKVKMAELSITRVTTHKTEDRSA